MKRERMMRGIVPVLVVPMVSGGEPDIEGIHRLVEFLLGSGVGGLWVLGSASEDVNMSVKQRVVVARETAAAVKGRVPIVIGTGLTSINDNLEYAEKVSDLEMIGIHVLPYDLKMGDSRLIHFFETLAEKFPHPLWMYHNPKRGRPISDSIIKEVKEHPNIGGIKIGGYNLSELTQTMMHRSPSFDVVGAGGGQLFQMLCLGAEAHTTSEASVYPERFIQIYQLFQEGKLDKAREKQFEMIRLARSYPRTDNGEYCAEEKYMLSLRGICGESVNPLYRTLTDQEKGRYKKILLSHGFDWARD